MGTNTAERRLVLESLGERWNDRQARMNEMHRNALHKTNLTNLDDEVATRHCK